jgi:hypothetical protein
MKKLSLLFVILCLLATLASAQDPVPLGEVYGGYAYVRVSGLGQVSAFNANGGIGAFQFNVNRLIGLVAEFGGYSGGSFTISGQNFPGSSHSQFTYLFGPRLSLHKTGKFNPFAEFFIGGDRDSRSATLVNSMIPPGLTVVPPSVTITGGSPNGKIKSHQNAFAMLIGGGVDIKFKKWLAVRPVEVDWLPTHFSPLNFNPATGSELATVTANNSARWQQNFRYTGGITFRFGSRGGGK